jgi:hypothetical protein
VTNILFKESERGSESTSASEPTLTSEPDFPDHESPSITEPTSPAQPERNQTIRTFVLTINSTINSAFGESKSERSRRIKLIKIIKFVRTIHSPINSAAQPQENQNQNVAGESN